MTKKEDLYIEIIKFGESRIESGITFKQLCDHVKGLGYEVAEYRMRRLMNDCYDIMGTELQGTPWEAMDKYLPFTLKVESTFRLIEYREYKSANKSSKVATYFASAALIVSIISAGASIYYSNKQLNTPAKIDSVQLEAILKTIELKKELNKSKHADL